VITQRQQFTNTQRFRSIVIVLLAVVALAGAAFFFGTGLRADTSASLAPSPLGSSLTVDRGSAAAAPGRSADSSAVDFASLGLGPAAGSASAGSSAVDYASLGLRSAASTKPESLADLEARWAGFYAGLDRALKDAGARP
jgi:hypothetical protein